MFSPGLRLGTYTELAAEPGRSVSGDRHRMRRGYYKQRRAMWGQVTNNSESVACSATSWQGALGISHPLWVSDVQSVRQKVRPAGPAAPSSSERCCDSSEEQTSLSSFWLPQQMWHGRRPCHLLLSTGWTTSRNVTMTCRKPWLCHGLEGVTPTSAASGFLHSGVVGLTDGRED